MAEKLQKNCTASRLQRIMPDTGRRFSGGSKTYNRGGG